MYLWRVRAIPLNNMVLLIIGVARTRHEERRWKRKLAKTNCFIVLARTRQ